MQNLLVTLGTVEAETWKTVGWVALIIAVIAVVIVLLILLVGKVFRVDTDEKVTKILEKSGGRQLRRLRLFGLAAGLRRSSPRARETFPPAM